MPCQNCCKNGQMIISPCPGTTCSDTSNCTDKSPLPDHCTEGAYSGAKVVCLKCEDGFFLNLSKGWSYSNCTACLSCNMGEYISSPCSEYSNTVCTPCNQCKPFENTSSLCNGTGLTDTTVCTCPLPENCLIADCSKDSALCATCAVGYYLKDGLCLACGSCQTGEYIARPCESCTNTVCLPCTPCPLDKMTISSCTGSETMDATVCE
jgi:hypothetical protein